MLITIERVIPEIANPIWPRTSSTTISSSSLIDLPISSISHADYDNLAIVNGNNDINGQTIIQQQQSITKSPISCEVDQKTKDAIDARLKDIDDEFESNSKNFFFIILFL